MRPRFIYFERPFGQRGSIDIRPLPEVAKPEVGMIPGFSKKKESLSKKLGQPECRPKKFGDK